MHNPRMLGNKGMVIVRMPTVNNDEMGQSDTSSNMLRVYFSSFLSVFFLVLVFGFGIVILGRSWLFEGKALQVGYLGVVGSPSLISKYIGYVICIFPIHHLLSTTYSAVSQILWRNLYKIVSARNWNLCR